MQCADCLELHKEGTTRCRHCGSRALLESAPVEPDEVPLARPRSSRLVAQAQPCRRCGRPAPSGSLLAFCAECRGELDQESSAGAIRAAWARIPEPLNYALVALVVLLSLMFGTYLAGRVYRDRKQNPLQGG